MATSVSRDQQCMFVVT